jgi:hypothetical protein
MNNPIILEKGYNTSGLYAFVTGLFYNKSDSINKILNTDIDNIGITYIQEYIKSEFINRLQDLKSVPEYYINRFRNILISYGWRKIQRSDIDLLLAEADPVELFDFLFGIVMCYRLVFERVDSKSNTANIIEFKSIVIDNTNAELYINDSNETNIDNINKQNINKVIDLSASINKWIEVNVIDIKKIKYSYRFKDIPYLIPVIINIDNCALNINKAIGFESLNDSVQKNFIWDFHSAILYDENKEEYSSLVNDSDDWYIVNDVLIPSNQKVDMNDSDFVNKIARQIKMIFYKIK